MCVRPARASLAVLALSSWLAGCAALLPPPAPPARLLDAVGPSPRVDAVLLGEVHDHPGQHRMRAAWLEAMARRGRFVIAMEQLDAERQPDLDAARAAGVDAHELARRAGFDFKGWDWTLYRAYFELALRFDLPLVAANLSAAQARRIARGEAAVSSVPAGWRDADDAVLSAEIRDGHCGMLPERAIAPMVAAQRARDARLAQAVADARRASGLPVVLLAGNGHVRQDVGVPRHLAAALPGARMLTVGLVERDGDAAAQAVPGGETFDLRLATARHPRPDPCARLEHLRARPPASKSGSGATDGSPAG